MVSVGRKFGRQIAEIGARFSVFQIGARFSVFSNADASPAIDDFIGQKFGGQIAEIGVLDVQ
jgi:hypothetical protein